jgi:hypothetical protein
MERTCTKLIGPGMIDTPLKLQLVLLFCRNPSWSGAPERVSEWLHESPWAVEEALEALFAAGLLERRAPQNVTEFRLNPSSEHWLWLDRLVRCFEDPLERDSVYQAVRNADRERQFRACAHEQVRASWLDSFGMFGLCV